jgi:hypothetical protein
MTPTGSAYTSSSTMTCFANSTSRPSLAGSNVLGCNLSGLDVFFALVSALVPTWLVTRSSAVVIRRLVPFRVSGSLNSVSDSSNSSDLLAPYYQIESCDLHQVSSSSFSKPKCAYKCTRKEEIGVVRCLGKACTNLTTMSQTNPAQFTTLFPVYAPAMVFLWLSTCALVFPDRGLELGIE